MPTFLPQQNYLKNAEEINIKEGTYQAIIYIPQKTSAIYESPYQTINIRAGKLTEIHLEANADLMISGTIDSTPATPENLSVVFEGTDNLLVTWDPVIEPDLAGYYLYRTNKEGRLVYLAGLDKETVSFQDSTTNKEFYFFNNQVGYAISSFDEGGNESFWSEIYYISSND